MIAKVIPIKRLPRSIAVLDYGVPQELHDHISPGQLVIIPFRKSEILGLVFSCGKNVATKTGIKNIKEIIQEVPLLSAHQLRFLSEIAAEYGIGLGTIAKMMLPPLQKRKLRKIIVTNKTKQQYFELEGEEKPIYHHYQSEKDHQSLISNISPVKGTLILVPERQYIDTLLAYTDKKQRKNIVTWHSSLTQKQQFDAWFRVRNEENIIVIGTRGSVFLPFQHLAHIYIDYEHDEQHKHWDQAPRFHAKDICKKLSLIHNASMHLMSYSPSEESYFDIHKKNMLFGEHGQKVLQWKNIKQIHVVDMKREKHGKNFSPLSFKAETLLQESKENVFIYINRKGFATSIACKTCGEVTMCDNCHLPFVLHAKTKNIQCHYCNTQFPIPVSCSSCRSGLMQIRGFGTEHVETYVKSILLPHDKRSVVRIDSTTTSIETLPTTPHIIVGTDMAFPHINWERTELIVFAGIDSQLFRPEYTSTEQIWHTIQRVQYYRKKQSNFVIQTHAPEHVALRSVYEPDRLYRTDLNLRRSLLYPPYSQITRYFYGHEQAQYAKKEAMRVYNDISAALTKEKKKIKLLYPTEMHPHYFRKKFWYTIVIKSDKILWKEHLIWINQFIPQTWKIDPNPISLLSP